MSEPEVVDVPERSHYELRLGDEVAGVVAYTRHGDVLDLVHTEIEPGHEGHNHPPVFRPIGSGNAASEEPTAVKASPIIKAKGLDAPKAPSNLTYSAPSEDGDAEVKGTTVTNADDPYAGVSRNAKCPCGSGKKYKQCHGAPNPGAFNTSSGG